MNSAKKMFKVDTQAGNACIYTSFVMLNFCLFLSSLGILGADIFLFVKIGMNTFSWVFLGLGLGLLGCSLASFKLRKSIHLLGMYLMAMFGIFFFMLIATILLLVQKQGIVEKVIDAAGVKPEER
jgi:apolipoprotein N-acyltransferase